MKRSIAKSKEEKDRWWRNYEEDLASVNITHEQVESNAQNPKAIKDLIAAANRRILAEPETERDSRSDTRNTPNMQPDQPRVLDRIASGSITVES